MRRVKFIALLFTIIFLVALIPPQAIADPDDKTTTETSTEDTKTYTLGDNILLLIYKFTKELRGFFPWSIPMIVIPPISFVAEPNVVSLEYLTETEIIIGVKNETTGEWNSKKDFDPHPLFPAEDYTFELITPDYLPEGVFTAHFDPQAYEMGTDGEQKTKFIISSKIPEDVSLPQNIVLWVNVTKWVTGFNTYLPPKGKRGIMPFSFITGKSPTFMWFFSSIGLTGGFPFGSFYSGKRVIDAFQHIPILVKINRFHLAEVEPSKTVTMGPDDLVSIPVMVRNFGSHVDTFNFKVFTDSDSNLVVSPPSAITLDPHETGYVSLSVASSEMFQDLGTAHSIYIQAYSIYDNEKFFNTTATVITRGAYVSELNVAYSVLFLIVIFMFVFFYWFRRKRVVDKICKKPKKPWTLPEEKKKLEKLKEKDKEKYDKALKKMDEEYEAEMSLYKDVRKSALKRIRKQKGFLSSIKGLFVGFVNLFKQKEKPEEKELEESKPAEEMPQPVVEKPVEIQEIKEQKIEEVPQKPMMEAKQVPPVDKKLDTDKWMKEQAILRVMREQEKQRKKLRRS